MPLFDLPLAELRSYSPESSRQPDFDAFWDSTLAQTHEFDLDPHCERVAGPLSLVDVFDVEYSGWEGHRIKAWLLVPSGISNPIGCVVQFFGYGAGRGFPHQWMTWPAAGYATLVMDNRGQGLVSFLPGDTPDPDGGGSNTTGYVTQGILDPETYYYRRLYMDAVRATEVAAGHPMIDPTRIAVAGASQGGALSIAAAALSPIPCAAVIDNPFLTHVQRAVEMSPVAPFSDVSDYLRAHPWHEDRAFATLSYFDGANLAPAASVPALFATCLMDTVCPPSTAFAAFNAWGGSKQIEVYPFGMHDAGGPVQTIKQYEFLATVM